MMCRGGGYEEALNKRLKSESKDEEKGIDSIEMKMITPSGVLMSPLNEWAPIWWS